MHRGWPRDRDAVRARLSDVSRRACGLGTLPTRIGRWSRMRVGVATRRWGTSGGVSSVAARTDDGAGLCLLERSPAYSLAVADRRAIREGIPAGAALRSPTTSVSRFGTNGRSSGWVRARAFLTRLFAKWSSRRDQRWPLLRSPDATFIETVPQACIIRSYPRSRYVVSRPIADRRCRRCRGRWRFDDRVRSQALETGIPSRRV